MVNGVLSFIRPLRSLLIFLPHLPLIKMVVFAQVIMLCGSQHYSSQFDRSMKNTAVKGTSKHHSFRKRSSGLERGKKYPFILKDGKTTP